MAENNPSRRLVDQRLRNRIIEELAGLAEGDAGVVACSAVDWFESFFDYFPYEGQIPQTNSAITEAEWSALAPVIGLMQQACGGTPRHLSEDQLIASGWPLKVALVAQQALDVFLVRGRFSEELEEDAPSTARDRSLK